jgi:hypothetical protein
MEMKYSDLDLQKQKTELLEDLLKQKMSQANALKESMKTIEAYTTGTKDIAKKIKDVTSSKKKECLDLFVSQKINPDVYQYINDVINAYNNIVISAETESDKIVYTKQCEMNFLSQEYSRTKELQSVELNKLNDLQVAQAMEKKRSERQYRPDQDPNTPAGRAAMDLMARKKAGKANLESEEVQVAEEVIEEAKVIVDESLTEENVEDKIEIKETPKEEEPKRGRKKKLLFF